jgi:hypothetical protein
MYVNEMEVSDRGKREKKKKRGKKKKVKKGVFVHGWVRGEGGDGMREMRFI